MECFSKSVILLGQLQKARLSQARRSMGLLNTFVSSAWFFFSLASRTVVFSGAVYGCFSLEMEMATVKPEIPQIIAICGISLQINEQISAGEWTCASTVEPPRPNRENFA